MSSTTLFAVLVAIVAVATAAQAPATGGGWTSAGTAHHFDKVYGNTTTGPTGRPMIAIRGLYHSGTSWARSAFTKNARGTEYVRMLYGHKHQNMTADICQRLRNNPRHTMVFVFRGLFSWLPKMYEKSYNEFVGPKPRSFSQFLRAAHYSGVSAEGGAIPKARQMQVANFIALRTMVYWNWVNCSAALGCDAAQTDNITYEEQVSDQCGVMRAFFKRHRVETSSNCSQPPGYVKYGKESNRKYTPSATSVYMRSYKLSDLAFVMSQIDPQLETLLGYSYDAEYQWATLKYGAAAVDAIWNI